jgi:hypothetical protein
VKRDTGLHNAPREWTNEQRLCWQEDEAKGPLL